MMQAIDDALVALQQITEIATEQTQVSQALAIEVSGKMQAIDTSLTDSVVALFHTLRTLNVLTVTGTESDTENGTENELILTSTLANNTVTALSEYEQVRFVATATNTDLMSVAIDGLAPMAISNIVDANQIYQGALVTLTHINGAFYLTEQINPKTGHAVNDIGKLIVDTTEVLAHGEVVLDGSELSRATHPILWAKISATLDGRLNGTSNLIDQASKNADPITYGGYYGEGDGVNTFTLPIVGGEFIRMFDDARGVDADREFGSWQEDAIRNITGTAGAIRTNSLAGVFSSNNEGMTAQESGGAPINLVKFDASRVVPTANENRPRSIAYYAKTRL